MLNTLYDNLYGNDWEDDLSNSFDDEDQNRSSAKPKRADNPVGPLDMQDERLLKIGNVNKLNIGWNQFQDLKLILYSINFFERDLIEITQLEKRMTPLLTLF